MNIQASKSVSLCATRCPRCIHHERMYQAPLGKMIRNIYARVEAGSSAVHDDCKACNGTGYIPGKVTDSIVKFVKGDTYRASEILSRLAWSLDHFSFMSGGMYIGVETSGYLHS